MANFYIVGFVANKKGKNLKMKERVTTAKAAISKGKALSKDNPSKTVVVLRATGGKYFKNGKNPSR